jgi:hypothetical protein
MTLPSRVNGLLLTLVLVVVCAPARGGETKEVVLADGARVTVDRGRFQLRVEQKLVAKPRIEGADPKGEVEHLEAYRLAGELTAVHARAAAADGRSVEAVAIHRDGRKKLGIIWQGPAGLRGEVGERIGQTVRFEDLTGDGAPEIIVGQLYEAVRLCGAERLPLLFRKVYDPRSDKLRPVLASRPDVAEPADLTPGAEPADGQSTSLVGSASPVGASRSAGDRGDPLLLAPPATLVDGDPATAWIPGNGAGAGEFATFTVAARAYGVVRIGVRAVPAGDKATRYDRPRSLLLVTEGRSYRLKFVDDPKAKPNRVVWFDLPEPARTGCLSLVVEQTFDPSPRKLLALAELTVLTEVDSPAGLERLARDLDDADKGEQAAILLRRAGKSALEPIRGAFGKLDQRGRRRAVRVLAEAAPVDGADLLAAACVAGDSVAAESARAGIVRAGDAGVAALARFLASEADAEFERATQILARVNRPSALDALIAATGSGGRERRRLLREHVGGVVRRLPQHQELLWRAIEVANGEGADERLFDLMRAAVGLEPLAAGLNELAGRRYFEAREFADRYRLLQVLARGAAPDAREHLQRGAADEDRLIRMVAVEGLGRQHGWDQGLELVVDALTDPSPEVRIAALAALKRSAGAEQSIAALQEIAQDDPWPEVRVEVLALAAHLPTAHGAKLIGLAAVDASRRVRLAAMKSAPAVKTEEVGKIVEERLADAEEDPEVIAAAARAAGKRCQGSALALLYDVLRQGAEPLARSEDITAAVEAARAIGRIGGVEGQQLLEKARRRSNPSTDKAIDAALADLGVRCDNPVEPAED